MRPDPPFELSARPGSSDLARRPRPATELLAPVMFRPALEMRAGETFEVEVAAVERIGGDSIVRCLDRIGRRWSFEVITALPVELGDRGTVRCTRPYRTLPIRWVFTREGGAE